jgi:aspartyl protease family protein
MVRIALAVAAFAAMLALAAPHVAPALLTAAAGRPPAEPGGPRLSAAVVAPAPEAPAAATDVVIEPDAGGQFAAEVEINGQSVPMLVDTGATLVVLSYEMAERIGLRPYPSDYTLRTQTANGVAAAAPVTLNHVAIGPIYLGEVQALVAQPGALRFSLLGMSFMRRLSSVEQRSGRLVLRQ